MSRILIKRSLYGIATNVWKKVIGEQNSFKYSIREFLIDNLRRKF